MTFLRRSAILEKPKFPYKKAIGPLRLGGVPRQSLIELCAADGYTRSLFEDGDVSAHLYIYYKEGPESEQMKPIGHCIQTPI